MWKVTGFMNGDDGNAHKSVYGPLPVKHWVNVKGEKRHKVRHRPSNGFARSGSAKEYTEQRAVLYAEWLAARDGLAVPEDCNGVAVWGVSDEGSKRVRSVEWRKRANIWGRDTRGAALLTVNIPHWDWVPKVTEETVEDGGTLFANSLTSEQYIRLVNIAHTLTPEEELMYSTMSDDELVAELQA